MNFFHVLASYFRTLEKCCVYSKILFITVQQHYGDPSKKIFAKIILYTFFDKKGEILINNFLPKEKSLSLKGLHRSRDRSNLDIPRWKKNEKKWRKKSLSTNGKFFHSDFSIKILQNLIMSSNFDMKIVDNFFLSFLNLIVKSAWIFFKFESLYSIYKIQSEDKLTLKTYLNTQSKMTDNK